MATDIIARYLLNEAASGQVPANFIDDTGNSNDMAITYSGADGNFSSSANGSEFDFGGGLTARGRLLNLSTNGTIATKLSGLQKLSLTIDMDIDAGAGTGSRIFQIGTDASDGDLALVYNGINLELRFDEAGTGGTGQRAYTAGGGKQTVTVLIDTTEAVSTDRVKFYFDGVLQSTASCTIPLNHALPALGVSTKELTLGNRGNGARGIDGRVTYFELNALLYSAGEITEIATDIAASNDTDWNVVVPNVGPVANNVTYDIFVDAQNNDVVGLYAATDADGTIASYSLTGSVLGIDNAGNVLLLSNTGIVAGTPITSTVTATDNDGATDTAIITVNVNALALGITTLTAGTIVAGDSVVIQLVNVPNATGKTLSIPEGAITPTAQDISSITFDAMDLKTFGDKTGLYDTDITITVTDGGESDTITFQISPDVGDEVGAITALTGIWADPAFAGLAITDVYYTASIAGADFPEGAVSILAGVQVFDVFIQDQTDGIWGTAFQVTIPASGTAPVDTTKPVIALIGSATISHTINTLFIDLGADVTDNVDSNSVIYATTGGVDANTVGVYVLNYDYTDAAGNVADTVIRTVTVADEIPVITLNGPASINVFLNTTYTDAGAIASDNVDADSAVVATGTVNTAAAATYTLTYNFTDTDSNAAITVYRTVKVVDPDVHIVGHVGGVLSPVLS